MFLSILNLVLIFSPMGNNNDTHSIIIFNLYMESATSGYVASQSAAALWFFGSKTTNRISADNKNVELLMIL